MVSNKEYSRSANGNFLRVTFYIKRKTHDKLRKKSFVEKKSMSKIVNEYIDKNN